MTTPLPDGTLLAGRYQVRRALAGDGRTHLHAAVDDGGARPELRVLLVQPADAPADLRQSGVSAGPLTASALDCFEHGGQRVMVLDANGGLTLADPLPAANDLWLTELLLVLAQLLTDVARCGADLGQVTASHIVLVPGSPGVRYVGPLVAGGSADLPAAMARLREELLGGEGVWTSDLRTVAEHWRDGTLAPLPAVLEHLSALSDPRDVAVQVGLASDAGRFRRQNEDAALRLAEQHFTAAGPVAWSLVALADGMGGHRAGRQAANLALHTLATTLAWQGASAAMEGHAPRWDDNRTVATVMLGAVDEAHRAVAGLADAQEARAPGCTLTASLQIDRRLFLVHIGDSRAYLLRDGQLEQLTRDDTLVQSLVDDGSLSAADARAHPVGHVLTQALGQTQAIRAQFMLRLLWPGDRLLFCSDGVTESLDDHALARLLAAGGSAAELAEAVVTAAIAAGSRDNVTAIVQHVG